MSFKIATAYVSVEADDSGLRADITAKVKAAADGATGTVRLHVDSEGLAEKVRAEADAADAETHVKVKVDDSSDGELRQGIERLGDDVAGDADQAGSRVGNALANGLFRDAQGKIRNASGQFASDAERLAAGFDKAGDSSQRAGDKASSSAGGFKIASVGVGTLAAAGVSLIPVLAAIPAVAAAAAAGIAVLGGAFGGVTKALHDYGAMDNAVGGGGGGGGGQTAATAYSNAVAIRNAEQAITDARTQAARSAQQDSEQVANSAQGVQDAERSAAAAAQQAAGQIVAAKQQIVQAAYAGLQAEQAYTNAVYNEQQADQALVNARLTAANQLVDSQNSATDAHLATEQAALNSTQAHEALAAAQGNSTLTGDQRTQIDLAAQQASQQLANAKQHEKEATEAANAATTAGVDKAPAVLSAEHAAQQAAQATANAQHGIQAAAQQAADAQANLAKAQQTAADQQASSAEQVAKAEQGLTDAERQQAQDRADSAQQIAKAQQNLTDTIKQQQLQSVGGASAGSAAVNQFAKDMANLSPAGRAFVNQLISMKGEFHNLALEAQTATLPGFTQMLKDSRNLLPVVRDGIRRIGGAFSDTAASAGKLFANPDFDAAAMHFEQIVSGGFAEVMSGLPPLMNAVVTSGAQAGPLVNALAVGIHNLETSGLPAFLSGLTTGAGGAAQSVGAILTSVDQLLGPIGTLAGAFANAFGPAIADLLPHLTTFVIDVEQDLLPLMPQLSTDLLSVSGVLDALLQIATPVAAMIANDLAGGLRIIDPLLQDTSTFLQDNQRWLVPVAEGILGVVVAVKAWGLASGIAKKATDLWKTATKEFGAEGQIASTATKAWSLATKEFSAEGQIASTATKAWGVATSETAATVGKAAGAAGLAYVGMSTLSDALGEAGGASTGPKADLDGLTKTLNDAAHGSQGAQALLDKLAGSFSLMQQPLGGAKEGVNSLDQALLKLYQADPASAATAFDQLTKAFKANGASATDIAKNVFPAYTSAIKDATTQQAITTNKTNETTNALSNQAAATQTTTDKFAYMTNAMSQSKALDQFHSQLLNLEQTLHDNGTSLDGNTAKGLANRQAFADIAQQVENYGSQLSQAGESDGLVAVKMQDMVSQLEDQAGKFGYNKKQVDAYLKSIGLVPSSVQTTLTTKIGFSVNQAELQAAAEDIGHVVGHYLVPGNAKGGLITGPGSGTSDSILRRLSNNEYVMTAQAVQQVGVPFLDSLNYGNGGAGSAPAPRIGGTTPRAAAPTINLNYFGTQQPTLEQQQVLMRDLALAVRG